MGSQAQTSLHRDHLGALMRAEEVDLEQQDWKRLSGEKECRLLVLAVLSKECLKPRHEMRADEAGSLQETPF